VGDTPADISAARVHGLPTIAVATGNYSFDALMESEPEVCTTTLEALLAHTSHPDAAVARMA
jgi:phosphoglycolate phosphatase-like HAD superfamily hydrolase